MEEEDRLLGACEGLHSPLLRPLLVLAIETAMRRGELLDLRRAQVNLALRVVHLNQTKNGDSREVPLSRRAVLVLEELHARHQSERVFPLTGNSVRSAFDRLLTRAGISDLRFHDLRHEAISRLFEKGLNPIEVATISGHRELRMLRRYTHLRAANLLARLDQSSGYDPSSIEQVAFGN